jgi:deoxyhypusine synthase
MSQRLSQRITPQPMPQTISVVNLVDGYFTAYNSARLREICHLLVREILQPAVTVGVSVSGALTPAGFGTSILAPLIRAGHIDWIVSTGANLYHDMHYGLGMSLYSSNPFADDVKLRQDGRIRIYDIIFDYEVLLQTDAFIRELVKAPPFERRMGTAEFHYLLGKYLADVEQRAGLQHASLLSTAYECGVPIYTSSPGDSSIGMNLAALALEGNGLLIDPMIDVNETAAIAYGARESGIADVLGKSAAVILGGGSPKNFILQSQPQLHEVLGLEERGHDYFIQITDARPDTGGLSGATPSEAVSWGKVTPEELPKSIVCYADTTIALPLLTAYVMNQSQARPLKRLYDRRDALLANLQTAYRAAQQLSGHGKTGNGQIPNLDPAPVDIYPCGTPIL